MSNVRDLDAPFLPLIYLCANGGTRCYDSASGVVYCNEASAEASTNLIIIEQIYFCSRTRRRCKLLRGVRFSSCVTKADKLFIKMSTSWRCATSILEVGMSGLIEILSGCIIREDRFSILDFGAF